MLGRGWERVEGETYSLFALRNIFALSKAGIELGGGTGEYIGGEEGRGGRTGVYARLPEPDFGPGPAA
jgi:hypothetical protein